MKRLLSRRHAPVLAALAAQRTLLAFDFDGTLAPIVAERDAARMRTQTAALFVAVSRLYPCVVISGRARADVARRLGRAAVRQVVGDHGAERAGAGRAFAVELERASAWLATALDGDPGIELERKRASLAIHYRGSARKRRARTAIHAAIATLPTAMRVISGKQVVNLVPARAPHKGDALLASCRRERVASALYVGDDVTDEDVFALRGAAPIVTVRVGRSRSSRAEYYLPDQRSVDQLLARLVELRR